MYDPHEIARAAATCRATIDRLTYDGDLVLGDAKVQIDGERVGVDMALYEAALRIAQGRYPEAECIASDCIDAIARALLPWAERESQRLRGLHSGQQDGDDYYGEAA